MKSRNDDLFSFPQVRIRECVWMHFRNARSFRLAPNLFIWFNLYREIVSPNSSSYELNKIHSFGVHGTLRVDEYSNLLKWIGILISRFELFMDSELKSHFLNKITFVEMESPHWLRHAWLPSESSLWRVSSPLVYIVVIFICFYSFSSLDHMRF